MRSPIGFLATTIILNASQLAALNIQIDYSLDSEGFFNPPHRRQALRSVCDTFENLIEARLLAIDPGLFGTGSSWRAYFIHPATGALTYLDNLQIPADTIVIYAGGRNFPGNPDVENAIIAGGSSGTSQVTGYNLADWPEWYDSVLTRGLEGIDIYNPYTAKTVASWGGSISFDVTAPWDFSLSNPDSPDSYEFVSAALHEMCHVLGAGSTYAWANQSLSGNFVGDKTTQSHGGPVPMRDSTPIDGGLQLYSHWADGVTSYSFGNYSRPHGELSLPSLNATQPRKNDNEFRILSDLDLASLQDLGWPLRPASSTYSASSDSSGNPVVLWNSSTGLQFSVSFSTDLKTFTPAGPSQTGNGSVLEIPFPTGGSTGFSKGLVTATSTSNQSRAPILPETGTTLSPRKKQIGLFPPLPIPLHPHECQCTAHH